jgi:hypothetical protein
VGSPPQGSRLPPLAQALFAAAFRVKWTRRRRWLYGDTGVFRGSVERITGKVKAFVSGIDTDTDVASEAFHLQDPSN